MLIDELRQGTRRFKFDNEGGTTIEDRPPTTRELRCAEMLENLILAKTNLGKSIETIQREVVELIDQYNQYDREYKELEQLIITNTQ